MTAIKGTNSYVSLEEADLYFETRIANVDWFDSYSEDKEIALVTATSIIDNSSWAGRAVSETQALAWPRIAQIYDPRLGRLVNFSGTETEAPLEVRKATYELAIHLIQNPSVLGNELALLSTATPNNIRVGGVAIEGLNPSGDQTSIAPSLQPLRIKNMYSKYLNNGGSRSWYRVN